MVCTATEMNNKTFIDYRILVLILNDCLELFRTVTFRKLITDFEKKAVTALALTLFQNIIYSY